MEIRNNFAPEAKVTKRAKTKARNIPTTLREISHGIGRVRFAGRHKENVAYVYRPNREGDFLKELLKGF
jgi:hypothetical protein